MNISPQQNDAESTYNMLKRIKNIEDLQKNSWITSKSFMKRSLAVWGHFMTGYIIIAIPIIIIIAIGGSI